MAEKTDQEKMQAAQNELLQNQEQQRALLQQRQAEVAAMSNINQTLQQAAEVAIQTAGGSQQEAQQFGQSTGAILGKYGMPIVQRSSSSTPQGRNVIINNTNNITVPPMQHQPIVVRNNEESSGGLQKFKAWLTGVFARQAEDVSRRDREFAKQEGYLSRTSSKIMKRLEEFGSSVAESMSPKRIAAQMGSQLKTMLFLFGTYFLMANWGKILKGITTITDKVTNVLQYFGIIKGEAEDKTKGFFADLKKFFGFGPTDDFKTVFSGIFHDSIAIVTNFFKKEWEIRAEAAKHIKFPTDALNGGLPNFLMNVGTYLGDLFSVLLTGPKALSGSIGHSISTYGRQNAMGENQAWANKKINNLTKYSKNTSLGDASIVSGGNTMVSRDFSGNNLANKETAAIRQGQAISAMIKDNSGHVNTSGVMSGLERLKSAAGKKGVLVDPSFLESFTELGIPADKLYNIATKGKTEYYKFVIDEKNESELGDEYASFNQAYLNRTIKNKIEDVADLGWVVNSAAEASTNSFGTGHQGLNTYVGKSALMSGVGAWLNKQFSVDENTLRMVPEDDPREGVTIGGKNRWGFLRLDSSQINELKSLLTSATGNAKFSFSTADETSMASLDNLLRQAVHRRTGKSTSMMTTDYDSKIWDNIQEVQDFADEKNKEYKEFVSGTSLGIAAQNTKNAWNEKVVPAAKSLKGDYLDPLINGTKSFIGSNKILDKSSTEVKRRVAYCMKRLIDAGLSPGAAAGIVGNLLGEGLASKRFDQEYPDGSGPSAGIAGFHSYYDPKKKGELDNLKEYAKSINRYWGDLDVQVDYLINKGAAGVISTIKGRTSGMDEKSAAAESAYLWGYNYERFKGYKDGRNGKEYQKRIANALSVLERYSDAPIDFSSVQGGIYQAEIGGGGMVTQNSGGGFSYSGSPSGGTRTYSVDYSRMPESQTGTHYFPLAGDVVVTSGFGPRNNAPAGGSTDHKGWDLRAAEGTPIYATENNGEVVAVHNDPNNKGGKYLKIRYRREDGSSIETTYMHLSRIDVKKGDVVKAGQIIGLSGKTGTISGMAAHLDFRVKNFDANGKDLGFSDPGEYFAYLAQQGGIRNSVTQKGTGLNLLGLQGGGGFNMSETVSHNGLNYRGYGGFIEITDPNTGSFIQRLLTKSEFEDAQLRLGAGDGGSSPFSLAFKGLADSINDIRALNYESYTKMIAEMKGLRKTAEEGNKIAKESGGKDDEGSGHSIPNLRPEEPKSVDTSEGEKKSLHQHNRNMGAERWTFESEEDLRQRKLLNKAGMSYEMYSDWKEKQRSSVLSIAQDLLINGGLDEKEKAKLEKVILSGSTEEITEAITKYGGNYLGGYKYQESLFTATSKNLKDAGINFGNYHDNLAFSLLPSSTQKILSERNDTGDGGVRTTSTDYRSLYNNTMTPESVEEETNKKKGSSNPDVQSKKLGELFEKLANDKRTLEENHFENAEESISSDIKLGGENNIVTIVLDCWPTCTQGRVETKNGLGLTWSKVYNDIKRIEKNKSFFEEEYFDALDENNYTFWGQIGACLKHIGLGLTSGITLLASPYMAAKDLQAHTTYGYKKRNKIVNLGKDELLREVWKNYQQYDLNRQTKATERKKFYNFRSKALKRIESNWPKLKNFSQELQNTIEGDTNVEFMRENMSIFSEFRWGNQLLNPKTSSGMQVVRVEEGKLENSYNLIKSRINQIKFYQVSEGAPRYRKEFEALLKLSIALTKIGKSDIENMLGTEDPKEIFNRLVDSEGYLDEAKYKAYFGEMDEDLKAKFDAYNTAARALEDAKKDPKSVSTKRMQELINDKDKAYRALMGSGGLLPEGKSHASPVDLFNNTDAWALTREEAIQENKKYKDTAFKTSDGKTYYRVYNTATGKYTVISEEDLKNNEIKAALEEGKDFAFETSGANEIEEKNKELLKSLFEKSEQSPVREDKATGKKIRVIYPYFKPTNSEGLAAAQPVEILEEDWQKVRTSGWPLELNNAQALRRKMGLFRGKGLVVDHQEFKNYDELHKHIAESGKDFTNAVGLGDKTVKFGAVDLSTVSQDENGIITVKGPGGKEYELTPYDYRRVVLEGGTMRDSDISMWKTNVERYKQLVAGGTMSETEKRLFRVEKREGEDDLEVKFDAQIESIDYGNSIAEVTNDYLYQNGQNTYKAAHNSYELVEQMKALSRALKDVLTTGIMDLSGVENRQGQDGVPIEEKDPVSSVTNQENAGKKGKD